VFVTAKPFQPSLMSVDEAGAYPRVEYQPYPQTLDNAGKACQGQTLWLIMKIRTTLKNFIVQAP